MKWFPLPAAALLALIGLVGLLLLTPAGPLLRDGIRLAPGAVPAAYAGAIEAAAGSCDGVPAPVLAAQLQQESGWRTDAVSRAGAIGLAQFMPDTWASHGVDGDGDGRADPRNPFDAIWSAARFHCVLKTQVSRLPGDVVALTLAAYNAGPYAVLQYRGIPPYDETRAYVHAILKLLPTFTEVLGGRADGLTPRAAHVRQLVIDTFGVTDIDGFATDGHAPGSDHYTGRAIDVMLTPLAPANTALGWQIARYLQSSAHALGIKYLIWDRRIWSPERAGEGWRPYRHPSGRSDPTLDHFDHVHVSVW